MSQNIVNISARSLNNKVRKDGYVAISLYIRKGKEQKSYPTGLKTLPQHFSNEKGEFTGPKGDVIKLNAKLRQKIAEIDAIVMEFDESIQDFSLSYLIDKLNNPKLTYFKEFADRALQKEGKRVAYKTWLYNRERLNAIHKLFPELKLTEINVQLLQEIKSIFEIKGLKKSTLNRTYAVLNKYVRIAKAERLIKKNPFDEFKIGADNKTDIEYLTQHEIDLMEKNLSQYNSRQYSTAIHFLHSCYTGLRGVDSRQFDPDEHVKDGFLRMTQAKTGLKVNLPLNDKAKKLHAEITKVNLKVKVHRISTDLKEIIQICGIHKHITFNCARHSFAINSLIKGVPLEVVSEWMGHTNISTTQIYAKVVDSLSSDEMKKWNVSKNDWLSVGFENENGQYKIKMLIDGNEVYLPKQFEGLEEAKGYVVKYLADFIA
ncbi:tyrosine-type recombinase/integrase [Marivirga sp.]|uniref:tyrosine-type recombinase/integrase n=1 Tax=Marivirga sp. TaxID=2018662 RepID=UPI003DA73B7F